MSALVKYSQNSQMKKQKKQLKQTYMWLIKKSHLLHSFNIPCSASWCWPLWSIITEDVGGMGWKKPSVMASLSWKTCFLWTLESQAGQRNWVPEGTQSRQRTTASAVLHCWQHCFITVSAANLQFKSSGIAALNLFWAVNCLWVHADMVGVSSTSGEAGTVTEDNRSLNIWRRWSKWIK